MQKHVEPLVEHLFRHEAGKLIAVLTRIFGPQHLALAEDVVQDTLLKAMQRWKLDGVPANPTAWLVTVSKNSVLDVLRKKRHELQLSPLLQSEYSTAAYLHQVFDAAEIVDEQLRMMFVCCHPSITEESQVAIILKTLCGFSTAEIARAFMTNEETITKRLYRAREKFREEKIGFDLPAAPELERRLAHVLTAIYLLFNEGYHSTHNPHLVREDLLEEALRLGHMVIQHAVTRRPSAFALMALMCFHAARAHERTNATGSFVSLQEQDRSRWNKALIHQGITCLQQAAHGEELTAYHIEAAIAYEHCTASEYQHTDWDKIIRLYDLLLTVKPHALVHLNKAIALGMAQGPAKALAYLAGTSAAEVLHHNTLYHASVAEWHHQLGNNLLAAEHIRQALANTASAIEQEHLTGKLLSYPGI